MCGEGRVKGSTAVARGEKKRNPSAEHQNKVFRMVVVQSVGVSCSGGPKVATNEGHKLGGALTGPSAAGKVVLIVARFCCYGTLNKMCLVAVILSHSTGNNETVRKK
jgi:hypothetical protein